MTAPPPTAPTFFHRSARGLVVGHTGVTVAGYHSTFVIGLLVPLAAGVAFFGWRAVVAVGAVVMAVYVGTIVWRRVGVRGHPLRPSQLLRLGLLLALMLPAKLAANPQGTAAVWPLLPAAGLLLVIVCWAAGPGGGGRVHPVLVVYLAVAAAYPTVARPHTVLQRNRLVAGDVLKVVPPTDDRASPDAWRNRPLVAGADAVTGPPAAEALLAFTTGAHPGVSMDDLLRERLPPLEDVVLGAVPGPIGGTSGVAVIFGGLFLVYRGLIDFRVPLIIVATAWFAMFVLPMRLPTGSGGVGWRVLAGRPPGVGWAVAATFANYEVLASPLLWSAFFLAGSPSVRPLGRPARSAYAAFIGVAAAALQVYASVALGSYLAVFVAGLFASALARCLTPRPLV